MFRELKISAVLNGYIVKAGCQTLVFESKAALIAAFVSYLENPEQVEKEFVVKASYGMVNDGPQMAPADPYAYAAGAGVGNCATPTYATACDRIR